MDLRRLAYWPLFLLCLPQGLWLRARAEAGRPADGERSGTITGDRPLRLLALGDSIMEGVGIDRMAHALPGRLAEALADRTGRGVEWRTVGRSGAAAREIRRSLLPALAGEPAYDVVVLSVGVNDVTGPTLTRRWRSDLVDLLDAVSARSPDAQRILLGVPPMGGFPRLPQPLRYTVGLRARILDRIGAEVAAERGWRHLPTAFHPEPGRFADDGYHPNAESCACWAEAIVATLPPLR